MGLKVLLCFCFFLAVAFALSLEKVLQDFPPEERAALVKRWGWDSTKDCPKYICWQGVGCVDMCDAGNFPKM
ncbi:hypothetical protein Zmor_008344 [Zophobas morio]|uniref:Uncharacterized protein n=1 Tax=Zophobas morio TaxID=2755281 RepID=A0AA38IUQ0_9CUCU|nr:hypothetical protein Zmor_008344 [Zophobas morio]